MEAFCSKCGAKLGVTAGMRPAIHVGNDEWKHIGDCVGDAAKARPATVAVAPVTVDDGMAYAYDPRD